MSTVRLGGPADPRQQDPLHAALAALIAPIVQEAVMAALAEHAAGAAPEPLLLTREQLAQRLGCSVATVARFADAGCPRTWLLDSPRFELVRVLEWLRARGPEATDG